MVLDRPKTRALRREVLPDGAVVYNSPALGRLGVPHAFTTRIGPGGRPFGSDPLTPLGRAQLAALANLPGETEIVTLRQVHGRDCLEVLELPFASDQPGDALLTEDSRCALAVFSADCVPILVASADGRRVAAIHAGWRGLVQGVVPAALVGDAFVGGTAAIGACLGIACAEMGPEVIEAFRSADLEAAIVPVAGARDHVDVELAARLQLERAGLRHIDVAGLCTFEHAAEFYSYRREVTRGGAPKTGRLFAVVATRREPR